ncbi:MAG: hypothetical protein Q8K63_06525 [Acidimicrobiales bacterium]|nr:hypothetical protein [Acidimicrobiales bacterium]
MNNDTDNNRPDPAKAVTAPMSVEHRHDYEAAHRLNARYGRNWPQPVDLYGDIYSIAGRFVVVDGHVCAIEPVVDEDNEPVMFTRAMCRRLMKTSVTKVMRDWNIPEPTVVIGRTTGQMVESPWIDF